MKILIFDPIISGHHLEYLHHLYMMAVKQPQDSFVFVVHKDFEKRRVLMDWPMAWNIIFDTVPVIKEQRNSSIIEMLKSSWRLCGALRYVVDKHNADRVFTNNIISFVPFAPLFVHGGVDINGIIYHIYLYTQGNASKLSRVLNRFKYQIMARSKAFGKIYILNDQDSADALNEEYKCNKFVGLPDPFVPISTESTFNFREKYDIPQTAKVFAHFGGLAKRKGTLDIIQSIRSLDNEKRSNYWFVFAGVVSEEIKDSFYHIYDELKNDSHIIVKDEFCSYEYLASLCQACDAILAPYHETDLSSGMFGYASQFGKPLIVPSQGLIGKIVRQHNLGVILGAINEKALSESYDKVVIGRCIVSKDYLEENNVEHFQEVISKNLCK